MTRFYVRYWLDLFTGTTWQQFQDAGARVSGFRERRRKAVDQIQPDDVLICYMTGVQRWVGALRVTSHSTDTSSIWGEGDFPCRLDVEPVVMLTPEQGLPMEDLLGRVDFFEHEGHRGGYKGFLRGSPTPFRRNTDGELIVSLLKSAKASPTIRPVDEKKLKRQPYYRTKARKRRSGQPEVVTVSVPDTEPEDTPNRKVGRGVITRHTEMQFRLLDLGASLGLEVWVARNDRNRKWKGTALGDMPKMVSVLPTQFNEATTRTIELIDVLWLRGNTIVAAFEVECTTLIYSGLLRMSDLLALQPNLAIDLYLVAPDSRRSRVEQEMRRPTFTLREKPLNEICGFLSFNRLEQYVDDIGRLGLAQSLKPDFLGTVAEYFSDKGTVVPAGTPDT